jgi:adenosylcobinamide hydrolase
MNDSLPIDGLHLVYDKQALHLRSDTPLAVLSSAVVGSELGWTRHIINMHVDKNYANCTPSTDLVRLAHEHAIVEPFVGLMTAASLKQAQVVVEHDSRTMIVVIMTVGVGNAVAAGITPAFNSKPGTINTIIVAEACLSPAARVNAVITATEAKTLALVEAGVRAPHGGLASGTSTDAIVVASTERGALIEYAGPISPIGALIARGVRRALQNVLK